MLFEKNVNEKPQNSNHASSNAQAKKSQSEESKKHKKFVFFLPRPNRLFSLSEHVVKKPNTPLVLLSNRSSYIALIFWIFVFCHLVYFFYTDSGYKSLSSTLADFVDLYYMEDGKNKKTIKFSDVKGHSEVKEELSIVLEYLKDPDSFAENDIQVPRGILLTGPPGVGKTMLVRALAGEADVKLFVTSGAEFEQMLVGVGASRVRNLFNKARKNAPCLIFIDEIDTFGQKNSYRDHRATALNQFLVEMDGFKRRDGVIVIAATNNEDLLEPSLLRPGRFDRKVFMDIPDMRTRKELIESSLQNHKNINFDGVNVSSIAKKTVGFSGAEIENIVNMACIKVVRDVMENMISNADSENESFVDLDKLKNLQLTLNDSMLIESILSYKPGRKEDYKMNEQASRHIATCVAAQAIVVNQSPSITQSVDQISILPRKGKYGYIVMSGMDSDAYLQNRFECKSLIDVSVAPIVAESMVFDSQDVSEITMTALADSTDKARRYVATLGMPDSFSSFIPYSSKPDSVSNETLCQLELESTKILEESKARVKQLLVKNWQLIEKLANQLLLDEEMDGPTLKQFIDNFEST